MRTQNLSIVYDILIWLIPIFSVCDSDTQMSVNEQTKYNDLFDKLYCAIGSTSAIVLLVGQVLLCCR